LIGHASPAIIGHLSCPTVSQQRATITTGFDLRAGDQRAAEY